MQILNFRHCLEEEKKWLIQTMIECRDMHIADEKVNTAMKESGTSYPSRQPEQPLPPNGKELDSEASKIQAMTALPHERNKFIEVIFKPNDIIRDLE